MLKAELQKGGERERDLLSLGSLFSVEISAKTGAGSFFWDSHMVAEAQAFGHPLLFFQAISKEPDWKWNSLD